MVIKPITDALRFVRVSVWRPKAVSLPRLSTAWHLPYVDGRPGRDLNVVCRARRHLLVDDGAVILALLQLDDLLLESAVLLLRRTKTDYATGPVS